MILGIFEGFSYAPILSMVCSWYILGSFEYSIYLVYIGVKISLTWYIVGIYWGQDYINMVYSWYILGSRLGAHTKARRQTHGGLLSKRVRRVHALPKSCSGESIREDLEVSQNQGPYYRPQIVGL